jgi:hypothetical protein
VRRPTTPTVLGADQRIFRCRYSDVVVLGKAVTRGPHWRTAGLAIHTLNGALGIEPFDALVDQFMFEHPYKQAQRVFLVVDNEAQSSAASESFRVGLCGGLHFLRRYDRSMLA